MQAEGRLTVAMPEYPDSEKKLNQWLKEYYELKKEELIRKLRNQERRWYLSEQGITLLGQPAGNSRPEHYCIPYEYAADYMEDKYLPVTKKAEADCNISHISIRKQSENKEPDILTTIYKSLAYFDINGDNIPDTVECLWEEGKTRLRADINKEVTYIHFNTKGTGLEEMEGTIDGCTITILRDETGESAMEITLYKYNGLYDKQTEAVYIYDILGEKPVFNKIKSGLLNSFKDTV